MRHITNFNLNGALDANGKSVTAAKMVANIKEALDVWLKQVEGDVPAKKSEQVHSHPHTAEPVHSHQGYKYSVSIEPA